MAIEKEIPKDISKYEPKFAGPFTVRQLVFTIPGVALGLGCYFLLRPYLSDDINFFISFIVAAPFLLCGWVKIYGIPFEKYVSIVFISQVLAPKHRKYRSENMFSDLKEKSIVKKDTKKKKHKEYSGELTRYD